MTQVEPVAWSVKTRKSLFIMSICMAASSTDMGFTNWFSFFTIFFLSTAAPPSPSGTEYLMEEGSPLWGLWSLSFSLCFMAWPSSLSMTVSIAEYMSCVSNCALKVVPLAVMVASAMCLIFSTESTQCISIGSRRYLESLSDFSSTYFFRASEDSMCLNVTLFCIYLTSNMSLELKTNRANQRGTIYF